MQMDRLDKLLPQSLPVTSPVDAAGRILLVGGALAASRAELTAAQQTVLLGQQGRLRGSQIPTSGSSPVRPTRADGNAVPLCKRALGKFPSAESQQKSMLRARVPREGGRAARSGNSSSTRGKSSFVFDAQIVARSREQGNRLQAAATARVMACKKQTFSDERGQCAGCPTRSSAFATSSTHPCQTKLPSTDVVDSRPCPWVLPNSCGASGVHSCHTTQNRVLSSLSGGQICSECLGLAETSARQNESTNYLTPSGRQRLLRPTSLKNEIVNRLPNTSVTESLRGLLPAFLFENLVRHNGL